MRQKMMKNIPRLVQQALMNDKSKGKALLLLGPRRVGKTALLRQVVLNYGKPYLWLEGEDMDTTELLMERTKANYKRVIGNHKLIVIDEAQHIAGIGTALKFMVDQFPDIKLMITGSSQFDLSNKLGEPLTGRSKTFHLFPVAQCELTTMENAIETKTNLLQRLVYGSYPEIWQYQTDEEKSVYLKDLVNNYLLKDVLAFESVKNASKIFNLLRMVAFQIGKEISYEGMGRQLGMSKNTVERYLDLLSKVFVLYKLTGYSRNLNKEIVKTTKWYFYDNGVRNAVIANFNSPAVRNDIGELWENYILSERIKWQHYSGIISNNFFWRTYDQQEIDWIEERNGNIFAYETKWNKTVKKPVAFGKAYPKASFETITKNNYLDWIGA